MGTSASNGGPKGSPPLLPDWYDDAPPSRTSEPPESGNDQPDDSPSNDPSQNEGEVVNQPVNNSNDWGTAKGALTRVSNNTGGSSQRKAANKYVGSLGGARTATRAAARGIAVGSRYAGFLGSLASNGISQTLTILGLAEYVGRSPEEVCVAIANALAPIGATNDEAIARDALIATLDALYTKILDAGGNIETLDNLTPELLKETLIEYVSNFVFTKWMYELGSAIEKGNVTEQEAIELEREVRDLIMVETIEQYRDVPIDHFNLNDSNSFGLITEIFQTAYSTLEL